MFIICFNEQLDVNFHILPILVKYHYNGLHRPLKHFMSIRHYLALVYLYFHIISRVDLLVFNNFNYQRVQITLLHQRSFSFFSGGSSIGGIKLSLFMDFIHFLSGIHVSLHHIDPTSTSLYLYCFPPPPPPHFFYFRPPPPTPHLFCFPPPPPTPHFFSFPSPPPSTHFFCLLLHHHHLLLLLLIFSHRQVI